MTKQFGNRKNSSASRKNRNKKARQNGVRHFGFETLEPRRLLSTIGLNVISNINTGAVASTSSAVTLDAGTTMLLALDGSDTGNTVNFGVSTSGLLTTTGASSATVTPTATLMPSTNKTVDFTLNGLGTVAFQLFDNLTPTTASHIETLVDDGFYTGDEIYRAQSGFVLQGGNDPPTFSDGSVSGTKAINTVPSGVPSTIDEEFNPELMYSSAGSLAMARTSSANTSGTEFFITESTNDQSTRDALDYSYTLFGYQTLDPTVSGTSNTVDEAIQAMTTETSSGLSYLTTPVKITSASIVTDTQDGVLMLQAPTGVTGTFTVTVTAADGTNTPVTQTFTVNVVADPTTGEVSNPWASQTPTAPLSLAFVPQGQGTSTSITSENNSSTTTTKELQFTVTGTTSGDRVTVYADGVAIGSTVASTDQTTVTSTGSYTLSDGTHTFTATQTAIGSSGDGVSATWTDTSSNSRTETADVESYSSPALQLQVDTSLAITSATTDQSVKYGGTYTYQVTTNAPTGDAVTVTQDSMPTLMTFDGVDTFTWTPNAAQEGTSQTFTATVKDAAGNEIPLSVTVNVTSDNGLTVVAPPSTIAVGSPVLVGFNDSNGTAPTYTVTTSNSSDLTATLMPETNPVLKVVTNLGEMDFQLLDNYTPTTITHIEDLINSGTYNPSTYSTVSGTFELQVGSTSGSSTTAAITFNTADLTATASSIQAQLVALGFTGAKVTVVSGSASPEYSFNVTFQNPEPELAYVSTNTPMPVTMVNSVTGSSATQELTFVTAPAFYRVVANMMDQGGVDPSGTGSAIPVELNSLLRFTSSGLLAMANDGVDGNTSEFFVTNPDDMTDGYLDFRYTIFGKLVSGENVREAIASETVGSNASGESSVPTTPIIIESMSVGTDTQDGVLMLQAQSGATSGSSYTVTVSDGLGGTQSFTVTVGTNSYDPSNPWVEPINGTDKIFAAANQSSSFTATGMSADNSAVTVNVQVLLNVTAITGAEVDTSFLSTSVDSTYPAVSPNPNLTLTQSGSSYTVKPTAGFYGVQLLEVTGQSATAASWDSSSGVDPLYRAFVPVFVAPPAPVLSSITAGGQTVTGSTFDNNSSSSTELSFSITGAVSGATVSVYVDGGTTALVTGTVASGATTISLTTTGSTADKIGDGPHTFTVEQTIATEALTAYVNWSTSSNSPGDEFGVPASTVNSAASSGTALTIGLAVLAPPLTSARVESLYTFVVQTNAPSGDTVTVTPVTMPTGMSFNNVNTFTWTPTTAQLNTSLPFDATVTDSQGRSATISTDITVVVGLAAVQVPVNETLGGNVTISFSNGSVLVFNNITDATLSDQTFKSTDTMEIDCPAGQSNSVTVMLPSSYTAAIPHEVYVNGTSGGLNNQVTVYGNAPTTNYFTVGSTVSANGLQVTSNNFQKLTLTGKAGDDDYELKSSSVPLWIVNTGNQGTLDFSQDTAGVTVNLGLDKSQAQYMSGWGTSLMLNGVLNEIIGTKYADTLHGGPAATTIIRSGAGNDMIVGGSGNNILVGGGGNDTITGGPNKNLLIAGSGTSTLNAGGSMNMAFGGSTNYDTNDQALLNLLNQGPNFMWGYSVRRAMASAAKNKALLANMLTLTDSGAHDVIFGSGPNNWFVPGKNGIVKR